jgi:hypothetical protein
MVLYECRWAMFPPNRRAGLPKSQLARNSWRRAWISCGRVDERWRAVFRLARAYGVEVRVAVRCGLAWCEKGSRMQETR